ncbi:MAG TPA: PDZ domain-containing protein [Steroidobacteraceae bacterium]|nr:PDZ domain-containing protein [Steroidobacteraceae bacterium]
MKRWLIAVISGALLAGTAAAAPAEDEEASPEERLQDAQRRLEDAAREVAELSGEAAGPRAIREFDFAVRGPRRAMLGVNVGGAEPNGGGVRVDGVSPGGPAAEAGVKAGDVIVAIDAKPVATGRELVRAMEAIEPGEKVELGLERDGKPLKLSVEARLLDRAYFVGTPGVPALSAMPALPALPAMAHVEGLPFHGDVHWLLGGWGDAEFVTLTPQLGRYFGADKGVLVARAPDDASLGLQDGDVIVAIGGREPQDGPHAMRILRSYQPGEPVEIKILRDRRTRTLSAKVPERVTRNVMRRVTPPKPPVAPAPPAPPARDPAAT